ncbi:MAG: tRNA (adenosine(37)-N6)-threonylcarbamoyltransferase complex ATPase subunit type 1 TsaE [Endomicrobiales bacterium]|nr:tRNA (adenosine(37)-N6)-threonylcarbamoyltransferase complex ATPase subunit type 1 TsaE [Endomicrobiales bacterium]
MAVIKTTTYIVKTLEDTAMVASKLAKELSVPVLLLFYGNLGSGKTAFIKLLANALGAKAVVRSPSFTLINEYKIKNSNFFHIDLYRLKAGKISELGLEEYIYGNGVCAIEWADKLNKNIFAGSAYCEISITLLENLEREIKITWNK